MCGVLCKISGKDSNEKNVEIGHNKVNDGEKNELEWELEMMDLPSWNLWHTYLEHGNYF